MRLAEKGPRARHPRRIDMSARILINQISAFIAQILIVNSSATNITPVAGTVAVATTFTRFEVWAVRAVALARPAKGGTVASVARRTMTLTARVAPAVNPAARASGPRLDVVARMGAAVVSRQMTAARAGFRGAAQQSRRGIVLPALHGVEGVAWQFCMLCSEPPARGAKGLRALVIRASNVTGLESGPEKSARSRAARNPQDLRGHSISSTPSARSAALTTWFSRHLASSFFRDKSPGHRHL